MAANRAAHMPLAYLCSPLYDTPPNGDVKVRAPAPMAKTKEITTHLLNLILLTKRAKMGVKKSCVTEMGVKRINDISSFPMAESLAWTDMRIPMQM